MKNRVREALALLQEECAEVIVEVSKCNRFGLDSVHYKTNKTHQSMLETEIADVLVLIDILIEEDIINISNLDLAKAAKTEKLKVWTKLYEQT